MHEPGPHSIDVLSGMLSIQRGSRGSAQAFFYSSSPRVLRHEIRAQSEICFIVNTISR